MGVDFNKCGNCGDILNSDSFRQCEACHCFLHNCNSCDKDNLIKEKDFDSEKYKKECDDDKLKGSTCYIYMGKSEKPKQLRKRITLCDECIPKYNKQTQKKK